MSELIKQETNSQYKNTKLESLGRAVIPKLAAWLLRLLRLTFRWKQVGFTDGSQFWPYGDPRIIAFWHSDILFLPWIYVDCSRNKPPEQLGYSSFRRPFIALMSKHRDGQLIAKTVKHFGVGMIGGSSSRDGLSGLLNLIKAIKQGSHIAITPDGPRGPARKVKGGVVKLAQLTGAKIYPVAVVADKAWYFKSWDKMFIPKPFSSVEMRLGPPITIPDKLTHPQELEQYQKLLEEALNQLKGEAANP